MRKTIQFVLDGRIVEVGFSGNSGIAPTTTLLNYLRSLEGHHGVKEGCAEGDCGACTVVLGERDAGGNLSYRSVDSCLVFLPMIHGKQVITVENLAVPEKGGKNLHPVQQQMVEANGSQCGYCTPGIVMSLFGIYKNYKDPSREVIEDALTGNLCRCTGYQPILEAAVKACALDGEDHFTTEEGLITGLLKKIGDVKETIDIKSANQRYLKPFTLAEALRLRIDVPEAIVINGSTDVALRQTKKHELLEVILDLSGVEELSFFRQEQDQFVFGAGCSIERLKGISEKNLPALFNMLRVFGSLQIRNLATIGGNVCSASPIGDVLPVLIAYRAKVRVTSGSDERTMDLEKFITGYRKTDLRKDELLTEIVIPKPDPSSTVYSHKVSRRRDLDISTVSAGFMVQGNPGKVSGIALVYGGMAERVKRARATEKFLLGKEWTRENINQAMKMISGEFTPLSDARSEAEFRSKVAANLLLKFFLETTNKTNN